MRAFAFFMVLSFLCSVIYANPAAIAYASNNTGGACTTAATALNCPKYRAWDNATSTWGSEQYLPAGSAQIREARIAFSPLNQKRIVVTEDSNGVLNLYVSWDGGTWYQTQGIADLWSSAPTPHYRGFDIAFERSSGDALIIFTNGSAANCDLSYTIVLANETTNGSFACIDDSGTSAATSMGWVAADSDPVSTSDEIIVVAEDRSNNDVNGWVWSGSAWGNQQEVAVTATQTADYEAIGVKYSADGSDGMVIGTNGTAGAVVFQVWGGSSWSAPGTSDITSNNDDVTWLSISADPATDDLMVIAIDNAGISFGSLYWNGASWTLTQDIDTAIDIGTTRPVDFAWNPSGSTGQLVWDTDTTGSTLSNRTFSGGAWGATATFSTYAGGGAWIQMATNPTIADSTKILGGRMNLTSDIGSFNFTEVGTGYTNYGDGTITGSNNSSTILYESFKLAFMRAVDLTAPTVANTSVNASSVNQNEELCINATAFDQNWVPISSALAQVSFPNGTVMNFSMSDTGCNSDGVNDNWFGVSIPTGTSAGTIVVNTTFANDSFGNMGNQAPYPNLAVTVSSGPIVDTSISVSTLSFGSLDPATSDNAATENPITFTNTGNSNTAVDVYLNNSNMSFSTNVISFRNLTVSTENAAAGATDFNGTDWLNGSSANMGFIENLAVSATKSLYFWQDVPAAQTAGTYGANVTIHAVANGASP